MNIQQKTAIIVAAFIMMAATAPLYMATAAEPTSDRLQQAVASCDVSRNTLGNDSADSMPLGNGDIGLHVWTEQNGN